jgi:hypothetical protein
LLWKRTVVVVAVDGTWTQKRLCEARAYVDAASAVVSDRYSPTVQAIALFVLSGLASSEVILGVSTGERLERASPRHLVRELQDVAPSAAQPLIDLIMVSSVQVEMDPAFAEAKLHAAKDLARDLFDMAAVSAASGTDRTTDHPG